MDFLQNYNQIFYDGIQELGSSLLQSSLNYNVNNKKIVYNVKLKKGMKWKIPKCWKPFLESQQLEMNVEY